MKFYHYPKCGTCRKAARWLADHDIEVESIDIVESPPSKSRLKDLHRRSDRDLKAFFNTSGQSYRQGGFKERLASMTQAEMIEALAADGKLIKRPILDTGDRVLVGFREAEYGDIA
jgi:arsenate reductase